MCAFVAPQVMPRPAAGARATPGEEAKAAVPLELGGAASEISPRSDEQQICTSQPPTNASARARGDPSTPRNLIDFLCWCAKRSRLHAQHTHLKIHVRDRPYEGTTY